MMLRTAISFLCVLASSQLAHATILDLVTGNTGSGTGSVGGQFQVDWINAQSTGTGVIDSFLRIQQTGQERGYNTSLGTPLDDKAPADGFTRALTLGEVPTVTINGIVYRQFLLDINQNNNNLLSLSQIQIFAASSDLCPQTLAGASGNAAQSGCGTSSVGTGSLIEASSSTDAQLTLNGATKVFQMNATNLAVDAANRYEIQLDFSRNPGSGGGDMFLYVRNDAFTGFGNASNVILFSQFGSPRGAYASNDGFEEWAVLKATPAVPEPGSVILLGTLLCGLSYIARKRRAA